MSCTPTCHSPTRTQAHCAAAGCHRTFGSVTEFDRHRRGGRCLDPTGLGLVEARQVWASPERHQRDVVAATNLARLRSRGAESRAEPRTDAGGSPGGKQAENTELAPTGGRP